MLKNVYSVRIGPPQAKVSSFQQSRDTLQRIRIDRRIRVNAGSQDLVGPARFESNRAIVLNVSDVLPTDSACILHCRGVDVPSREGPQGRGQGRRGVNRLGYI